MPRPLESLAEEQIAETFRSLAGSHVTRRSVDSQLAWRRLQRRMQQRPSVPPRRPRSVLQVLVPSFIAALVAIATVVVMLPAEKGALSYRVRGAQVNESLILTREKPGALDFSDESRIGMERDSQLSVSVVGRHTAVTRLYKGKLAVAVHHERETDWRFFAGPFEVRVEGTVFNLGWDPEAANFDLKLHEGSVTIVQPGHQPRRLKAGESIHLEAEAASKGAASADRDATGATQRENALPAAASDASSTPSRRIARGPGHEDTPDDWATLIANGRFQDVVRAIAPQDLPRILETSSSSSLKSLAQAAHYTGHTAMARGAYEALRRRFPSSNDGKQAAFFLGRMDDEQGRPTQAVNWFDTYLAESPRGVYAAEALGRKLLIVQHTRGSAAAAQLAREYLAKFPEGAHHNVAQRILSKP